jgi:vitamin B12 transporter
MAVILAICFFFTGKLHLLNDKIIVSAGGRYDTYKIESVAGTFDKTTSNYVSSIGVAYSPVDRIKFKANYAEGFKMPALNELGESYLTIANEDLKPEDSKTWEIGFDIALDCLTGSVTYFESTYVNKIVYVPIGVNLYQHQNMGKYRIEGFKINLSFDIGKVLIKLLF